MIIAGEHHGYKNERALSNLDDVQKELLNKREFSYYFERSKSKQLCFEIFYNDKEATYKLNSTYIIGVNWVIKGKLPIYIKPKLNNETNEVDYLLMLFEALKETENINHLSNLYTIDFNAPLIEIEQKQDILSPLLVIEFLNLLKQIVKKGLKKSYYTITKNLNTKVKGKIVVSETIKKNYPTGKLHYHFCSYQEFGFNSIENRLLKKALLFCKAIIANHKSLNTDGLTQLVNFVSPAFSQVSADVSLKEVISLKHHPFFKEYKPAITTAKALLKRFSYNIASTSQVKHKTPPFWIDMSKLFELYVFKKLKETFPLKNEIIYHEKFDSLEPDFLLKSEDGQFKAIIDAKYKPRYENGSVSHPDAAQVSGYARLKSIRAHLGLENSTVLMDTLIIYTSNNSLNECITEGAVLFSEEDSRYTKLYKYGIKIPKINLKLRENSASH